MSRHRILHDEMEIVSPVVRFNHSINIYFGN